MNTSAHQEGERTDMHRGLGAWGVLQSDVFRDPGTCGWQGPWQSPGTFPSALLAGSCIMWPLLLGASCLSENQGPDLYEEYFMFLSQIGGVAA